MQLEVGHNKYALGTSRRDEMNLAGTLVLGIAKTSK
jgi:hypothetical protein